MSGHLDRRALLRLGLHATAGGVLALEQLGGVPLLGTYLDRHLPRWRGGVNTYDAFAMMGNALAGGPALLGVHQAMAQAAHASDWTLVQIKVCNHVYTPIVFKLGQLAGGKVTTDATVPLASKQMTSAQAFMQAAGVDDLSDNPRLAALRINRWFGNILLNGTTDGAAATGGNLAGLNAADVGPLDPQKVAVQGFLHLAQISSTVNHALKGCKMRAGLPDVTLFAAQKGVITSPLGISCFMMGTNYDRAEGAIPLNAVLDANTTETAVVNSRTVSDYVAQIGQFVGNTYVDRSAIEQNVVYQMDQLVQKDPKLRRDLLDSVKQFKQGLANLQACQTLETNRQTMDLSRGSSQADDNVMPGKVVGASTEFLAQCKYVAMSLGLPGVPVRNYSLFLNATDMDGNPLDAANDGGGGNSNVKALANIEAMRQLAMGLNILAKKIAGGAKMLVVVSSEGGRSSTMTDSKTSFALVLGPAGAGMLKDGLFANMGTINQVGNSVLADPGQPDSAVPWDVDGLKDNTGTAFATPTAASSGDVHMGVIEFLEGQTGVQARTGLNSDDGRFVKLARA